MRYMRFGFVLAIFAVIFSYASEIKTPQRLYGDIGDVSFVASGDGLEFVCNIDDLPPIIGENITVQIARLAEPPQIGKDKSFYHKQLALFLEEKLKNADIELVNITRAADCFAIVADVKVDNRYLAPLLLRQGLAVQKKDIAETKTDIQEKPDDSDNPKPLQPNQEITEQVKEPQPVQEQSEKIEYEFVGSKNSKIFHKSTCSHAKRISPDNIVGFKSAKEAISKGRTPCKSCKP